jgi:hypothetical protein
VTATVSSSSCAELTTELDLDEALAILEPYFFSIREKFVEAGLGKCRKTMLYVAPEVHDTPRHFAACRTDGLVVLAAPEMVELPEEFVVGILAHELGHATDFLYPGEFVIGQDEKIVRRSRDAVDDRQWLRWQRGWDKRAADVVERTADLVAGAVWEKPIGYAGPCHLQNFRTGEARPQGLR